MTGRSTTGYTQWQYQQAITSKLPTEKEKKEKNSVLEVDTSGLHHQKPSKKQPKQLEDYKTSRLNLHGEETTNSDMFRKWEFCKD